MKILRFNNFLVVYQVFYKDRITYYEPHALKECIRKDKCLYEKGKDRKDVHKVFKGKLKDKYDKRKKGFNHSIGKQDMYNSFK